MWKIMAQKYHEEQCNPKNVIDEKWADSRRPGKKLVKNQNSLKTSKLLSFLLNDVPLWFSYYMGPILYLDALDFICINFSFKNYCNKVALTLIMGFLSPLPWLLLTPWMLLGQRLAQCWGHMSEAEHLLSMWKILSSSLRGRKGKKPSDKTPSSWPEESL